MRNIGTAYMRSSEFYMDFLCEGLQRPLAFLCANRPLSVAPLVYADTRRERLRLGTFLNGATMLDFILLALGLGFFALSIAYAFGCDRL